MFKTLLLAGAAVATLSISTVNAEEFPRSYEYNKVNRAQEVAKSNTAEGKTVAAKQLSAEELNNLQPAASGASASDAGSDFPRSYKYNKIERTAH